MNDIPIIWQVLGGAILANALTVVWVWGLWQICRFERDNPDLVGQDSKYPLLPMLALIPAPIAGATVFWLVG